MKKYVLIHVPKGLNWKDCPFNVQCKENNFEAFKRCSVTQFDLPKGCMFNRPDPLKELELFVRHSVDATQNGVDTVYQVLAKIKDLQTQKQ